MAYANESELQALIAESPELVDDLEARPGVAIRELTVPGAGSLDVLIVHLDGALTLVEAKLNRNPEIRRAVVGSSSATPVGCGAWTTSVLTPWYGSERARPG